MQAAFTVRDAMAPSLSRTILLIESDPDVRVEIGEALERSGCRTIQAASGKEALEWLDHGVHRPTLIVLDWMMPVMDGWNFLSRQASDPTISFIPVVVLSAVGQMRNVPTLCVAAVLAKPVRLRTLIDVTTKLCAAVPRSGNKRIGHDTESSMEIPIRAAGSSRAPVRPVHSDITEVTPVAEEQTNPMRKPRLLKADGT